MSRAKNRLNAMLSYYGGKHNLSKWYPEPHHDMVIEPFAGSAGYAHRYWQRKVILNDADPVVYGVWDYLIKTPGKEILRLPLLEPGQLVSELDCVQEAKWLIGFWCYRGAAEPRNKLASWAARWPTRFWSEHIRGVIARQADLIKHWQARFGSYETLPDFEGCWFVDPPYTEGGKHYRKSDIDFDHLREWVLRRRGQVIVCERAGAGWLPGEHQTIEQRTQKRHGNKGVTKEAYWHRSSLDTRPESM